MRDLVEDRVQFLTELSDSLAQKKSVIVERILACEAELEEIDRRAGECSDEIKNLNALLTQDDARRTGSVSDERRVRGPAKNWDVLLKMLPSEPTKGITKDRICEMACKAGLKTTDKKIYAKLCELEANGLVARDRDQKAHLWYLNGAHTSKEGALHK